MIRTGKKKIKGSDAIFNIFNYAFFTVFTLICIYPFYYLFINTISANDLSANGAINFIPKGIHFDNYVNVVKIKGLGVAMWIS
ncbi:MAG: carbohydrate ABC transporter permease, partial [Mobilitalea sp.]